MSSARLQNDLDVRDAEALAVAGAKLTPAQARAVTLAKGAGPESEQRWAHAAMREAFAGIRATCLADRCLACTPKQKKEGPRP